MWGTTDGERQHDDDQFVADFEHDVIASVGVAATVAAVAGRSEAACNYEEDGEQEARRKHNDVPGRVEGIRAGGRYPMRFTEGKPEQQW